MFLGVRTVPAVAWRHVHFDGKQNHVGTGLPFPIEVAFLVLVLPIAFAYVFSVAGVVTMSARAALRFLASRMRRTRSDLTAPTH